MNIYSYIRRLPPSPFSLFSITFPLKLLKMAPHLTENNGLSYLVAPLPEAKPVLVKKAPLQLNAPLDSLQNLSQLLAKAADGPGGLLFYSQGKEDVLESSYFSYADLIQDAKHKARLIAGIAGLTSSSILLLHFDNQYDTIQWFWAATLAGVLPAISTPFVNDTTQRKKHLSHLQALLNEPIILTSGHLVPEFLDLEDLHLYPVESLTQDSAVPAACGDKAKNDPAVLMLTSGSTGSAKAVPLGHGQILKAVQGKSAHHGTETGDVFLNWVGLDHVASLTEIHLHASMYSVFLSTSQPPLQLQHL